MFGLFKKNPLVNLQKKYYQKLEQAMYAQKNGDIEGNSNLSVEADEILQEIEKLKKEKAG